MMAWRSLCLVADEFGLQQRRQRTWRVRPSWSCFLPAARDRGRACATSYCSAPGVFWRRTASVATARRAGWSAGRPRWRQDDETTW